MIAKIQKWGNSLGVRIPKVLAQEVALSTDSPVDLSSRDGAIIITPIRRKISLSANCSPAVTEVNLHQEIISGGPEGREAW